MTDSEKFMSSVKVGPKGQIVIPKPVREMFHITPGDMLLLLADAGKGIAIHKAEVFENIADSIFEGKGQELYPEHNKETLDTFASSIKDALENGEEESET